MKTKLFFTALFISCYTFVNGLDYIEDPSSNYQIIDLNIFSNSEDGSLPIAINDQGQVTGYADLDSPYDHYTYFWSKESGHQKIPILSYPRKLNSLGQIVGFGHREDIVLWDPNKGLIGIPHNIEGILEIEGFNDLGHILVTNSDLNTHDSLGELHFFNGINFIELGTELKEQLSGSGWRILTFYDPIAILNNNGEILINCSRNLNGKLEKTLFLYKDDKFEQIPIDFIDYFIDFDDQGNFIAISSKYPMGIYLINYINGTISRIEYTNADPFEVEIKLSNGEINPIHYNSIELVSQSNGVNYYQLGPKITDLLKFKENIYSKKITITDKNSRGWALGTIEHKYELYCYPPQYTTFIAIPKGVILNN